MLSAPLRSRFGIIERIDFYAAEDLADIVIQNAHHVDICIAHNAATAIGQSARGTPRIAKSIFRRVRDFAQIKEITTITLALAEEAMSFLGIDKEGLTDIDHRLITAIAEQFEGGPVGVETLASIIGEDTRTLEEVYEPFLIRQGYLEKTPRGRRIPVKRYREYAQKAQGQQTLL
jgi:Holliday junction DNA helicase RuvB